MTMTTMRLSQSKYDQKNDYQRVKQYDHSKTYVNAPLYGRNEESGDHPGALANVNDTVNWYIDQGDSSL